jgi:predicted Zn-dependent protease
MPYLEKATELKPEDSDLRFKYAKALVFSNENDKAIKELEYLLAKMPDNPTVYNNLGIAYFHKNDLERAIKYLSLEVEFNSNPRSFLLLGQIYGKLGKYSEAVDNLEKYLAYAPAQDPRRQKAEATLQFYRSQIK